MKVRRLQPRDERGAAALEFALVMPILLILILGIFNLGYLMAQQLEVNSAARQGGRMAVVPDSPGTTAADKATKAVNKTVGSTVPSVTTVPSGTICGTDDSVGEEMTVKVTYTKPGWLVPVPFFDVPAPSALTSEAVFRCEW